MFHFWSYDLSNTICNQYISIRLNNYEGSFLIILDGILQS